jgi:hypothetical protein
MHSLQRLCSIQTVGSSDLTAGFRIAAYELIAPATPACATIGSSKGSSSGSGQAAGAGPQEISTLVHAREIFGDVGPLDGNLARSGDADFKTCL